MKGQAVFSPRTVFWLITAGLISFGAALAVMIFGQGVGTTARANSFSTSAIGHRALVELLDELGYPTLVSRHNSVGKVGSDGLLVLAEPTAASLAPLLSAPNLLYVLPKRTGSPDLGKREWLRESALLPPEVPQDRLSLVVSDGTLVRPAGTPAWRSQLAGLEPDIEQVQLIRSGELSPVVTGGGDILLGRMQTAAGTAWVLSDPDLLSNHGLGRCDNAVLMVRAVEAMNPDAGPIVFDETSHGFKQPPSLWRTLFDYPFVVVTIQALATLTVLLLAATERFGAPLPPPRVLPEGKAALLANTAELLSLGGHGRALLARYVKATLGDVAGRLQLPARRERDETIAQLDRMGAARGVTARLAEIDAMANAVAARAEDSGRILEAAGRLYQWKREILDEPGRRTRD